MAQPGEAALYARMLMVLAKKESNNKHPCSVIQAYKRLLREPGDLEYQFYPGAARTVFTAWIKNASYYNLRMRGFYAIAYMLQCFPIETQSAIAHYLEDNSWT